nr:MAG TPA: hypothetical protein [Caudoviricetes sp.]
MENLYPFLFLSPFSFIYLNVPYINKYNRQNLLV